MLLRSTTLRRLLASKGYYERGFRSTAAIAADALDMTDTFSRRHSKFSYRDISVVKLLRTSLLAYSSR